MKSNIPEEETLKPIIKDIESIVIKIFKLISNFLRNIGRSIKKILLSWKKLSILGLLGGALGAATLLIIPRQYESNMVLKTHFGTNEQLFNDVDYLNSLISSSKYDQFSTIIGVSEEEAKKINSIEVSSAANITERLSSLSKVYRKLDSALLKNLVIEELLENDKYTFTSKFKISIYATDPFIFENIEENLIQFFERVP